MPAGEEQRWTRVVDAAEQLAVDGIEAHVLHVPTLKPLDVEAIVNAAGKRALDNPRYVMRITGDSVEGKAQLDNFIDPEQPYPVIATTSQLLSTGVDAKTCKLIVLDRTISGGVTLNDVVFHVSMEDLPFGGVGPSGMGSYHGIHGFRTFSHAKAVLRQPRIDVAKLAGIKPPYGKAIPAAIKRQIKS